MEVFTKLFKAIGIIRLAMARVRQLRNRDERLVLDDVHFQFVELVRNFDPERPLRSPRSDVTPTPDSTQADRYLGPAFALASLIDDLFTEEPLSRDFWNARKLTTGWFVGNNRATEFWHQVEHAERQHLNDDLSVFWLAVACGFRGARPHHETSAWFRKVQERLLKLQRASLPRAQATKPPARLRPLRSRKPLIEYFSNGNHKDEFEAHWKEVTAQLRNRGIDPNTAPLFLVLGSPVHGPDCLFNPDAFKITDRSPRSSGFVRPPFETYVRDRAIFLVVHKAELELKPIQAREGANDVDLKTIGATSPSFAPAEVMPPDSRDQPTRTAIRGTPSPVVERLARTCRLLSKRPVPANGVLVWFSPHAIASPGNLEREQASVARDLAIIESETGLAMPVIAVLGDSQLEPGFEQFLGGFPNAAGNRLGFSLNPDTNTREAAREDVVSRTRWFCRILMSERIERMLTCEDNGFDGSSREVDRNLDLLGLLSEFQRREPLLRQLFQGAIPNEGQLVGCYVAATGPTPGERGFMDGILDKLVECRDLLKWTAESLRHEQQYLWFQSALYGLGSMGLVLLILLAIW